MNKMFVLLHEDDIYGSLQGSIQYRGDELDEELDAYFELPFEGSDVLGEE